MKQLLLILSLFFFYKNTAQNVVIPDANFKSVLISNYDTNSDGEISTTEAAAVTGTINATGANISDATGIEAFINITGLNVENNTISSLDISQNTQLTTVDVDNNNLSLLNLSTLNLLQFLYADNNQFHYIDLGNNGNLFSVIARNNATMTGVNLDNGNASGIFQVDLTNNPNLSCIQADATTVSNPPGTWLKDATASYATSCPDFCIVNIPDPVFKNILVSTANDLNNDNELQCSEALLFTGPLNVGSNFINPSGITDLTGIEALVNITELRFFNNPVGGFVDLSQNTQITIVRGFNTNITGIDFGNNPNLNSIEVYNNLNLTSMDITGCPNLQLAFIYRNDLSSIDLSGSTGLRDLVVNFNPLTTLDVSNNLSLRWISANDTSLTGSIDFSMLPSLNNVSIRGGANSDITSLNVANGNNTNFVGLDVRTNPNLLCVEVDDAALVTGASWSQEDAHTSYSEDCVAFLCTINIPDVNFKTELVNNSSINLNGDNEIQCNEAQAYTGTISVGGKNITDMTGIEAFVNITGLVCFANQITSLDVSANVNLTSLLCNVNSLSSLNVANGNNTNFTNFNATSNPSLLCIEVDDVTYSNTNWTNKDAGATYSTDCTTLSTPEESLAVFSVYPNPTSNTLYIDMIETNFSKATIYSIHGKKLMESTKQTIDVSNLSNGLYILKIIDKDNKTANPIKFIKE